MNEASWYDVKVTAHNSAGSTTALLSISTLTSDGRKLTMIRLTSYSGVVRFVLWCLMLNYFDLSFL